MSATNLRKQSNRFAYSLPTFASLLRLLLPDICRNSDREKGETRMPGDRISERSPLHVCKAMAMIKFRRDNNVSCVCPGLWCARSVPSLSLERTDRTMIHLFSSFFLLLRGALRFGSRFPNAVVENGWNRKPRKFRFSFATVVFLSCAVPWSRIWIDVTLCDWGVTCVFYCRENIQRVAFKPSQSDLFAAFEARTLITVQPRRTLLFLFFNGVASIVPNHVNSLEYERNAHSPYFCIDHY